MIYTDMTDEEYNALDEELTRRVPNVGPEGSDWITQRELRHLGLAKRSMDYLLTKAAADHKSPSQITDELVGKELAVAGAV